MLKSLVACIALGVASPAVAADKNLLDKAAKAAALCMKYMPNSRLTKDALKDAGYRYEGLQSGYHIYSNDGRRLIAATTKTSSKRQGCLISVSKMTPEEGAKLIQPWVKATGAQQGTPTNKGVTKAWVGNFKGKRASLGVNKEIDFRIMRGAAIGLVTDK